MLKYGWGRGSNIAISQKIPWANYKTCADIGTAQGDLVAQITLAHPHLNGVGYDLPVVGPIFDDYMQTLHLSDCVKFTPGSFFTDDVPQADVLLFGHILHDLDLAAKKMLLQKAFASLPPGGAVVVYEAIIDDDRSKVRVLPSAMADEFEDGAGGLWAALLGFIKLAACVCPAARKGDASVASPGVALIHLLAMHQRHRRPNRQRNLQCLGWQTFVLGLSPDNHLDKTRLPRFAPLTPACSQDQNVL